MYNPTDDCSPDAWNTGKTAADATTIPALHLVPSRWKQLMMVIQRAGMTLLQRRKPQMPTLYYIGFSLVAPGLYPTLESYARGEILLQQLLGSLK